MSNCPTPLKKGTLPDLSTQKERKFIVQASFFPGTSCQSSGEDHLIFPPPHHPHISKPRGTWFLDTWKKLGRESSERSMELKRCFRNLFVEIPLKSPKCEIISPRNMISSQKDRLSTMIFNCWEMFPTNGDEE